MNVPSRYCPSLLSYSRRPTREVLVGRVGIGGNNPIRVQSMITSDTRDTPACVKQVLDLDAAGCEIVRITAQTKVYAANLENIVREVRAAGCGVPIVADIHFKPDAAMEAAKWVEKVRVNPGNYADKKKFEVREYTDAEYEEELERIREEFIPLVHLCKDLGRAMRIGTNHGSLSDRIMNRFGDTPHGMVESALEFARLAREENYHNFVFSMKASNPKVMIEAYRLLVARLDLEGADWNYPIHLGVTEAGDGEDGRIKSAIGIGSLLSDGIGDTIRVSLTEDAVYEIPVAQALAEPFNCGCGVPPQAVAVASRRRSLEEDAAAIQINWDEVEKTEASYLPHWAVKDGTYAVTFRLADSLPEEILEEHRDRREVFVRQLGHLSREAGSRSVLKQLVEVRAQLSALQESLLEPALQKGHGECLLREPDIAGVVDSALRHFDGDRYDLLAWCVMPNHVHVVVHPRGGLALEDILHSWKSFTAHEINKRLSRTGPLWQKESYDHLIRDGDDFRNQIRYALRNPETAGLSGWTWVGSAYDGEDVAAGRHDHGLRRDAAATDEYVPSYDPFSYERRKTDVLTVEGHELGGDRTVRVFTTQENWNALAHKINKLGDFKPEIVIEKSGVLEIDPRDEAAVAELNHSPVAKLVTVKDGLDLEPIHAFRQLAFVIDARHPILLKDTLTPPQGDTDFLQALLPGARVIGSLLCDGIGDAILVRGETAPGQSLRLAYNILQAAGTRIFKTDYVACPSCGRTLFNLQSTTQKIRAATGHLKGVRIAVMGCIVNGPGEMADADFGYVGGAPGKINLYVGKTPVKFNIPEAEAVERLIDLIQEHGKWIDAPAGEPVEV
ncbi:(E)-4-hydroxy-3-methylbut-2-enyl-diphosphate synthase [Luteolibacter ambystomatis]|uniref:(E)-4-hydroxy-3-methylbut-2-enyl-diphosphate synthase n=1 Tax=Luteolibacter ambystomatis TaxID=2824561 RepID=UPI001CF78929|nr:(E)-4-hydroxy-3-methylbut-2-enyl-diphosphate synthase [Luteolibacter ambystomatis]